MEICNNNIYFRSFLDNQEERCQKQNYDIFDLSVFSDNETFYPDELFSPLFELVSNPESTIRLLPPTATQPISDEVEQTPKINCHEKVKQNIRDKNVKKKSRRKRQNPLKYKMFNDNTPILRKKPTCRPRNTKICVFCRFRHIYCKDDCITKEIYGTFTDDQMKKYGKLWENFGSKIFYYDNDNYRKISSNRIKNPAELKERIEQLLVENNDLSSSDEC